MRCYVQMLPKMSLAEIMTKTQKPTQFIERENLHKPKSRKEKQCVITKGVISRKSR